MNVEEEGFIERPAEMVHRERMKELMCYLWDNYLELHDSEHVVLMGVGDSYSAVRELLVNRGEDSLFLLSSFGSAGPGILPHAPLNHPYSSPNVHTLTNSPPRVQAQSSPGRLLCLRLPAPRSQRNRC